MTSPLSLISLPLLSTELVQLLLDISLKGVLILLFAGVIIKGLRQTSAAVRHLVWSLALSGLLALPVLERLMPEWQVPLFPTLLAATAASSASDEQANGRELVVEAEDASEIDAAMLATADAALANRLAPLMDTPSSVASVAVPADAATGVVEQTNNNFDPAALPAMPPYKTPGVDPGLTANTTSEPLTIDWRLLLLLVWAGGAGVVLSRLVLATLKVARIVRRGEPITDSSWAALTATLAQQLGLRQRVKLITNEDIVMPLTWGVFRPVVLLPAEAENWTLDCRRIVLLHELSHIKRRDCLTQTLAQIACALHWFNPLAHSAARQLRVERELACDDQVLAVGTRATDYAGYLVEIASAFEMPAFASPLTVGMACSQLESRVRSILNPDIKRRSLNRLRVVLSSVLTVGMLAPLAIVNPWGTAAAARSLETASAIAPLTGGAPAEALYQKHDHQAKPTPQPTTDPAQEAPTIVLKLKEEMKVELRDVSTIVANVTTEALLQAIDAQEGIGRGQGQGRGRGQGNGQGDGQSPEQEANRLRMYNITPEFIEATKRMGFDNLSNNQLVQFRIYGITEPYVNEVRSWGFGNPTPNQVVQAKIAGVTTDFVNTVKSMRLDKPSLNKVASLKLHNVTPAFVEEMSAAGYSNLTTDQLLSLRVHNITPQYIREVESWGYGKLSLNELMQVRIHNITPAFADEVKAMGFRDLSLKQLISVRIHGVNASFAREISELGFTNLTLDDLLKMKIHGITPDYVRKIQAAGYRNISVKQLIDYKLSGVDEILLKNSR